MLQDLGLDVAQLRPRLEPEFLCKNFAGALEGTQRVGLPVLAIQGDHQQCPPTFDERFSHDQRFELGGGRLDPAAADAAFQSGHDRRFAQ